MNVVPAAALGPMWDSLACAAPAGHARDALAVGIRAEAARLGPSGVMAQVAAVEYLGADTLIDTRVGEEPFVVRMPGRPTVGVGEQVSITWDAGATHWFDAASGRRID
jgi:sn-glycerol 3-phosphate transport system ATP-binding protein